MTDIKDKHLIQEIALQNLNDGVFVFDKDRKIIIINPACEQIVGFSKDEILQSDYSCLDIFGCHTLDGSKLSLCPGLELFEGKRSRISREYLIKTKDDKEKWVITNYSIIRNEKDKVEYVVGVIRDITERKAFNEEFIKYKTLSTLGLLSNELVHEIKNPLNSIAIQISLLEREINKNGSKPKKELHEVVNIIKEEIDRLNKLMKDCLEFSKSGSLNREYEDVGQIIKELLALINFHADINGITIISKTEETHPKILIDKDKLKQALLNLMLNAMEAMQGSGGEINISVTKIEGNLIISIKDTGPGIPREQHDKIFDLFYSTKSGGAGIGLAITQNIVHAHGGNIDFKVLTKGAEFTIKLPLT